MGNRGSKKKDKSQLITNTASHVAIDDALSGTVKTHTIPGLIVHLLVDLEEKLEEYSEKIHPDCTEEMITRLISMIL